VSGERDAVLGTSRPTATPCLPRPPLAFLARRVSAQIHNDVPDYLALAQALRGLRVLFET
jgi:hypothetical protein